MGIPPLVIPVGHHDDPSGWREERLDVPVTVNGHCFLIKLSLRLSLVIRVISDHPVMEIVPNKALSLSQAQV